MKKIIVIIFLILLICAYYIFAQIELNRNKPNSWLPIDCNYTYYYDIEFYSGMPNTSYLVQGFSFNYEDGYYIYKLKYSNFNGQINDNKYSLWNETEGSLEQIYFKRYSDDVIYIYVKWGNEYVLIAYTDKEKIIPYSRYISVDCYSKLLNTKERSYEDGFIVLKVYNLNIYFVKGIGIVKVLCYNNKPFGKFYEITLKEIVKNINRRGFK